MLSCGRRDALAVFALFLSLFCPRLRAEPMHVYLTWQGDTSKTITVNYQTGPDAPESIVYYDTKPRAGLVKDYRYIAKGAAHKIPGLADGRLVHHVEMTRLKPDTVYYFIAGNGVAGFSAEKSFRTIPDGSEPISFVTGGDMGTDELSRTLMRIAGQQDPAFGLIGGDMAYENGELQSVGLVDTWISNWGELMVTTEGHMVPMVLAIGNHEVDGGYGESKDKAPFYFGFFAQDDESYFARRFGQDLSIYVLDSGHVAEHGGPQARWLDSELQKDKARKHRFAVYHVPLYPSHRDFDDERSAKGRKAWLPIFDKHQLTAAFENHDHTFKRTLRLRDNKADPAGTLYLGDGCFGREAREISSVRRWYLAKASSTPHFWRVDVSPEGVSYTAIDDEGQVIDSLADLQERVAFPLLRRLRFWD
jgi:hypothetical protein